MSEIISRINPNGELMPFSNKERVTHIDPRKAHSLRIEEKFRSRPETDRGFAKADFELGFVRPPEEERARFRSSLLSSDRLRGESGQIFVGRKYEEQQK